MLSAALAWNQFEQRHQYDVRRSYVPTMFRAVSVVFVLLRFTLVVVKTRGLRIELNLCRGHYVVLLF